MSLETEVRIDIVSNNEEYLSVNIKKKKRGMSMWRYYLS